MVRHCALKYGFHTFPSLLKTSESGRMEAILRGIVLDHWSTVIETVTYIGFGFKNPPNLVLALLIPFNNQKKKNRL